MILDFAQSPNFVAFSAHCFFAAFVVLLGVPWEVMLLVAAVKEFYVDPRWESNQNIWPDGALDFAGYAAGTLLGALV